MDDIQKEDMPDFDQLNDRIIAQAPSGPFIGIRTNLDDDHDYEEHNRLIQDDQNEK